MNQPKLELARTTVGLQSALQVGALAALLGGLGAVLFGPAGLLLPVIVVVFSALARLHAPLSWVLSLYRAVPLSPRHELARTFTHFLEAGGITVPVQLYISPRRELNAWSVAGAEGAAVILPEVMLTRFTREELHGIIAHELGHIANRDLSILTLVAVMRQMVSQVALILLLLAILVLPFDGTPLVFSLLAIAAALTFPTAALLLEKKLSRTREFAADLWATELLGTPSGLIRSLARLDNYTRRSLFGFLGLHRDPTHHPLSTHPDTAQRIERLRSVLEPRLDVA